MDDLEDMVRFHLCTWWNLAYLNQTFASARRALAREPNLSYSLAALSIFGFVWVHGKPYFMAIMYSFCTYFNYVRASMTF